MCLSSLCAWPAGKDAVTSGKNSLAAKLAASPVWLSLTLDAETFPSTGQQVCLTSLHMKLLSLHIHSVNISQAGDRCVFLPFSSKHMCTSLAPSCCICKPFLGSQRCCQIKTLNHVQSANSCMGCCRSTDHSWTGRLWLLLR